MTGFLSELFSKLLIMSISASIVIIAIIFLRFILYKAPKSAVCVLLFNSPIISYFDEKINEMGSKKCLL